MTKLRQIREIVQDTAIICLILYTAYTTIARQAMDEQVWAWISALSGAS